MKNLTLINVRGCSLHLLVVRKVVMVPLRMFSFKVDIAGAFAVPVTVPNTEKRVENTTRSGVFLTQFEVFG